MWARLLRLATRSFAYAVLLVAAYSAAPLLGFLDRNREEIARPRLVLEWAVAVALLGIVASAAVVVIARRARPEAVGAGTAAVLWIGFHFDWVARGPIAVQYLLWLVAAALLGLGAAATARRSNGRLFLLVLGLALMAAPSVSYLGWRGTVPPTPPAAAAPLLPAPAAPPPGAHLPNVYFFVLDGYGRDDQLQRVLGYDNTTFDTALSARGFVVSDHAFTSYPATWLSITSMLELGYPATVADDLHGGRNGVQARLEGRSVLMRSLRALGYRYVQAESGTYEGTACAEGVPDLCIPAEQDSYGLALDEVEFTLLHLTPLRPLLDAGVLPLGDATTDPVRVARLLRDEAARVEEPFFLFAHVVSPHAPYRREADCRHRSRNVAGLGTGWAPDLRDEYTDALRCVNRQMLAAVDQILRDDPDAIFVVTADHGTAFTADIEQPLARWSPGQLAERYAVFHAARLPPACRTDDRAADALPNTFRIVLACIEGDTPDLLEPRAFFYRYGKKELEELPDLSLLR